MIETILLMILTWLIL